MLKLDMDFGARFCHGEHSLAHFETPLSFLLEFIFVLLSWSSPLMQ